MNNFRSERIAKLKAKFITALILKIQILTPSSDRCVVVRISSIFESSSIESVLEQAFSFNLSCNFVLRSCICICKFRFSSRMSLSWMFNSSRFSLSWNEIEWHNNYCYTLMESMTNGFKNQKLWIKGHAFKLNYSNGLEALSVLLSILSLKLEIIRKIRSKFEVERCEKKTQKFFTNVI